MSMSKEGAKQGKKMAAILTYTGFDMVTRINQDNIQKDDIVNIVCNGSEFILFYYKD